MVSISANGHVDFQNGNDTTGTGSAGNPWKTYQKAIDVAAGGSVIGLGNNATHILTGPINWDTGWAAGTSPDSPLIVTVWNNGGSGKAVVEIQSDNDVYGGTGVIPNDVYSHQLRYQATGIGTANLIAGGAARWRFEQCRITAAHSDGIVASGAGWNIVGCEIDNCGDDGLVMTTSATNCRVVGCWIHDNGASGIEIPGTNAVVTVMFCRFNGNSGAQPTLFLSVGPNNTFVLGNSFIGSNGSNEFAIDIDAASEETAVIGNIFKNYGGASGGAVKINTGGKLSVYGFNNFDNCTTTYNGAAGDLLISLGNDLTAAVAFANVGIGDFSHSVSALLGTMTALGVPLNYGADQSSAAAGGLLRLPDFAGGFSG